jgi:AraC-like DNA-binding protein
MEQIFFSNSFIFKTATQAQYRHNDNSMGIKRHYIAKMHSGTGFIRTLSGEELTLSAGDVFYLPRGLRYHSYWTPDEANGLPVEWESYGFIHFPDPLGRSFSMQKLFPSEKALGYLSALNENKTVSPSSVGLLYLFLGEVISSMQESASDPRAALFAKAEEYIRENTDFKVSELARACNMSESGLFAFFREYAHTTPISLKQKVLSERAVEALCCTDRSVEEIARDLGFCSSAHLRKTLKNITGKTPSEIRRSEGNI